jgi:hypothetical protein
MYFSTYGAVRYMNLRTFIFYYLIMSFIISLCLLLSHYVFYYLIMSCIISLCLLLSHYVFVNMPLVNLQLVVLMSTLGEPNVVSYISYA